MAAYLMKHDSDPAADLLKELGDTSGVTVHFNQLLVAIYIRPEQTKSGIFVPDKTRDEDIWQGKAALVVKKGPTAFRDAPDNGVFFHGQTVEVGDWIALQPSNGWPVKINGKECRVVSDVAIKLKIASPDMVY